MSIIEIIKNKSIDKNKPGNLSHRDLLITKYSANKKIAEYPDNKVKKIKHFSPASNEWISSTYSYNNNYIKCLPAINTNLSNLIKDYFNLYNKNLSIKVKTRKSRRAEIRKLKGSVNKILISNLEFKHMNDKVIVTIYVYNTERKYFVNKLNNIKNIFKSDEKEPNKNYKFINKIAEIKQKLEYKLKNYEKSFYSLVRNKGLQPNVEIFNKKLSVYHRNYIKRFVSRFLRKEIISIYYKQLLAFNSNKFEKKYISVLANRAEKMYGKKVEFNFVNLKYLYFNSYILSTAVLTKIVKLMRVKKNYLTALKKSLHMIHIPNTNSIDVYNDIYNKKMIAQNIYLNNSAFKYDDNSNKSTTNINKTTKLQDLDKSITTYLSQDESSNRTDLHNVNYLGNLAGVFKSTKYKLINGVRVEIAGRLSRRKKATRSVFKIRNKGNIRNIDSSDKGLSTAILRGYAKSNLQYNKLNSKVHGGSFGFKG